MAGKVRGEKIDTREARAKLPERVGAPFYNEIANDLHLGYRKGKRGGKWVVRRRAGGDYVVERIGIADDQWPADGEKVLTFDQARRRAIAMDVEAPAVAKAERQGERRALDRRRCDGRLSRQART